MTAHIHIEAPSPHEQQLRLKAGRVMPAGGTGNVPHEVVIREGKGGRLIDESGNSYVDFLLGSGPMLVGHAHPEVVSAVAAQVAKGSTFFFNNAAAIELAETISGAVKCAEKVRYTSSGTEATHYAMRLARAHRRRDKIMKFEGGFHGMGDWALMSMAPRRPGNFPQAAPDSAGIPKSLTGEMIIAPFNDPEAAASLIRQHKDELAGVIVEPCQRLLPPKPGFLERLRSETREHGIPLIFDEIVTGFRFAWGGAQEYYSIIPDMAALGKVIGGGHPLAAVAGRDEIMRHFDRNAVGEEGFTQQTGTLSGNPIAAVAGLATLNVLRKPGTYETIFANGRRLMDGLNRVIRSTGTKAQLVGEPPMFDIVFVEGDVVNYRDIARADAGKLKRLNRLLLERGVIKGEGKLYISLAHTDADIDQAVAAFEDALAELRKG